MTDKVLCPYCGAEMKNHLTSATGGYPAWFNFKCTRCSAVSPCGDTREEAHAAALRRYTPPLRPMTLEELESALFCVPCWIECPHEYPFPEVLDKDSVGWFGKSNSAKNDATEYFKTSDYGKEWRCWERKPTQEEMEAAKWEGDND